MKASPPCCNCSSGRTRSCCNTGKPWCSFFDKHIGWHALKEDIVQMYMQAFTEQELETINAFYITPARQTPDPDNDDTGQRAGMTN